MLDLFQKIIQLGLWLYGYCTDFVINLANLTGTSYYEVNAFIFCFLWPLLTLVLILWWIYLRVRIVMQRNV